ncbi:hypothetical protein M9Y10_004915 [Tritrichomonas musculus]|uniref:Lipocalin-like domain-containing protein n=1 Tax=Tritrichomonas musculus TaxID=1915356 RepID=A0ABR2JK90_9EUKA
MFLALFCILGLSAPLNISTFIPGNWNITAITVSPEGIEDEESRVRYEVVFQQSEESQYEYLGEIMGENDEGILAPILRVKLEISDEDPNEVKISIGNPESDDYDEYTQINANTDDIKDAITFTGKIANDYYSFISLSDFEAEITYHNHDSKSNTIYRLEKDRPPQNQGLSLMNFMPMIMMLMMQCMNAPRQQQNRAAQNGQGGGEARE